MTWDPLSGLLCPLVVLSSVSWLPSLPSLPPQTWSKAANWNIRHQFIANQTFSNLNLKSNVIYNIGSSYTVFYVYSKKIASLLIILLQCFLQFTLIFPPQPGRLCFISFVGEPDSLTAWQADDTHQEYLDHHVFVVVLVVLVVHHWSHPSPLTQIMALLTPHWNWVL